MLVLWFLFLSQTYYTLILAFVNKIYTVCMITNVTFILLQLDWCCNMEMDCKWWQLRDLSHGIWWMLPRLQVARRWLPSRCLYFLIFIDKMLNTPFVTQTLGTKIYSQLQFLKSGLLSGAFLIWFFLTCIYKCTTSQVKFLFLRWTIYFLYISSLTQADGSVPRIVVCIISTTLLNWHWLFLQAHTSSERTMGNHSCFIIRFARKGVKSMVSHCPLKTILYLSIQHGALLWVKHCQTEISL